MSYDYQTERHKIFTDDGQRLFLCVRDRVDLLLGVAGAARMQEIMNLGVTHVSWEALACVDRLIELGELLELPSSSIVGQHRVFVRCRKREP